VFLAKADHLHKSHLRIEERLGRAHPADKNSEELQRRLGPDPENSGVHGGGSSRAAISNGAVGDETWRKLLRKNVS
jgi:hypothetical protein